MSEVAELLLERSRFSSAGLFETGLLASAAAVFGVVPVLAVLHPEWASPLEGVLACILLLTALLAAFLVVWRVFGGESIRVADDALVITRSIGCLSRAREVILTDVTAVSVPPIARPQMQDNFFGFGHPAILVEHGAGRTRCGVALNVVEASELADRIRSLVESRRRRTRS